jgi:hypothetical protein
MDVSVGVAGGVAGEKSVAKRWMSDSLGCDFLGGGGPDEGEAFARDCEGSGTKGGMDGRGADMMVSGQRSFNRFNNGFFRCM